MKISDMSNTSLRILTAGIMIGILVVVALLSAYYPKMHIVRWLGVAVMCGALYEMIISMVKSGIENVQKNSVLYFMFTMWLIIMLSAAYYVGLRPKIMLWMLMIIVGADVGAWFFGKTFGGDKMWEKISANKTWAGQIGGIFCGTLMSVLYFKIFGGYLSNAIWIGISAALLSQYGDLTASYIKRTMGIKDFGNLLPGHGGILDRFDGWIYVLPLIWFMIS
ncbi:MAG: phosphatidate cytidylyltransferase [Alphaproteobacteria bacterium]|nr:phosphatidate cytidylyltransferase [Alphaproteobacteria bacterium]